ncbi:unnamed protein product (mitochondrion) [Plasmodiophora brassicae]|uniref:TRF2/HOY1 PH-like domain-containing protein n=1 Tax=Plasmodiophora brassicae TaxID=37360 RepID=A0A3P3Y059_PLABS|nr:unnamed protein product [Plasmodiophora brassicae]
MCTLVLARLCPVDASHTNRPSIRVAVQGPVDSRGALIIISYLGSLFLLSTTKNVPTAMVKQNEYSGGPWKQSAVYASRYREGSSPIATVGKASSAQWTDLCTDIAQSAVCADPVSAAMDTDGRPGAVRPRLKPKHKPVRARCRRLKIGSWDFVPAYEPIECKLLFSRKKLVWEWKADPNTKRKIEIGFTTIDNLYGDYLGSNVSRFVVTVKSLPVLYYGTVTANTPIKWAQSPDFTGGQIKTSSMHELDLSMDQAGLAVFLQSICDYSDSFGEMVRRRRSRDEAVLGLDGPAAEPALKRARVGSFVASPTIPTVSGTSPTKAVISSTATPAPVMRMARQIWHVI